MTEHWKKWRVSQMTEEECIETLMPPKISFWFYNHLLFVWRVYNWNWFNVWTGEEGFWLFAKHLFKGWKL